MQGDDSAEPPDTGRARHDLALVAAVVTGHTVGAVITRLLTAHYGFPPARVPTVDTVCNLRFAPHRN